jgi:hypothetical protein
MARRTRSRRGGEIKVEKESCCLLRQWHKIKCLLFTRDTPDMGNGRKKEKLSFEIQI